MQTTLAQHGFAPDPALASRDVLLDPDAVAQRLSAILGHDGRLDVERCGLIRAKYRIGESLRVVYRIDVAGSMHVVAGRAFPDGGGSVALRRSAAALRPTGRLRPAAHDRELDTVWWTFPNDRRLRGVDTLLRPGRDLAAPLVGVPRWTASRLVEYAPERSVTLRAIGADGATSSFIKAFAPGTTDLRVLARRYDFVARGLERSPTAVSSPRPLWWSDRHCALWLEAMPGRQWNQLGAGSLGSAMRRLGAALGALHDCAIRSDEISDQDGLGRAFPRFRRLDLIRIVHSAELIGRVRPDVAESARSLARALSEHRPGAEPEVLLHGDCHPKNALLHGDQVALIDLDQAGTGPAAADIGSFLARLEHTRLVEGADTGKLVGEFLDGYAGVAPLPSDESLAWHTGAALLVERAMRAVNRVHPEALDHLDELISAGHAALRTEVRA